MNEKIEFKIDNKIIKDYIETFNSINFKMEEIKKHDISKIIEQFYSSFPKKKNKIMTDVIKQIIKVNNGVIFTKMLEPLNISRQYLNELEKNNIIERISRGIYVSTDSFIDDFYIFQSQYKKAIFSHMNALYFYNLTEEIPYNFTITIPQSYHIDKLNEKCNIFYVSDDIYKLGLTEVKTLNGNIVKVYDRERCICDIIRSINRMDYEQVKKTIKNYVNSKEKNLSKLSLYSKEMGINKKVMKMVSDANYE